MNHFFDLIKYVMAEVYMYTVYNDLLTKITKENILIQRSRDSVIHKAMEIRGYPDFPINEYDIGLLFPFFKEITRLNPVLNVLLLYKLNGKDSSAILISNNTLKMYPNKEKAIDSITQIQCGNYLFLHSPVIR